MKFPRSEKKNKVVPKCNGDGQKWLPLPTPPPHHRTCNEPESYLLPVDTSLPPMHLLPQLKQKSSPRGATSSQTGENGGVPLSPRMVKVLGADGRQEEKMLPYLKSQKETAVVGRPWRPADSDPSVNVSPRRASTSAHVQTPQSPFSNRRGGNSSALGMHFENPSVANRSAHRSVTPTNRSVANFVRAQECSTLELSYGNELGSPSSLQFGPSTDWADRVSPGKASPIQECSTPQRSPRKVMGKSHESFQKPCKLPSPPRTPHQLDRRTQTCSSRTATALQDLVSRPRSLPSPNRNWESSPRVYSLTPPTSPRQHELKPAPSAPAASCLQKLTPPSSPRSIKVKPAETQFEYMLSPRNSPQRSIISAAYQDLSGSPSPLPRFLPQVPKPPKRWKRGAKIGSGSFGSVYEGWNLDDGTFFAVKVSNGDHIPPEIHQEVAVLSKLRHPNIVQYYGTTTENGSVCIFLELVKMGSLQSIMNNFQVFDEVLMSSYTRQILTGLEYLHSMNTIHRDIKCANILVDSDGQVKLADFGLAKQMEDSLATSVKGSPYYMAPEVLSPGRNKQPYGLEVDIWSLGCTVLEMAEGKPPWSGLQGYAFFFKVTNGELPPIPEHLSDTAKDFIIRCLQSNPKDRPTVKELLVHPFVAYAPRTFRASVPGRD